MGMISCQQKEQKEQQNTVQNSTQHFDISDLKINEDINSVLASAGVTMKDTISSDEKTLIGNEKAVFANDKFFVFKGENFASKNPKNSNNVIFHYGKVDTEIGALANEENDKLGMFQVNIYTKSEQNALKTLLEKDLNKPIFENIDDSVQSEVSGNEILPTGNKLKQEVIIWKNNNLVYYYFVSDIENKPEEYREHLFIFKNKEWKDFLKASGFTHLDKIPV